MRRAAAFLDRDGTLNREVEYLHRIDDLVWIPGAFEAVRQLNAAGLAVIVVTNQAGVARGYYEERDVERLHRHMRDELARHGAHIDAFYYSPYHPEGTVAAYRRASRCRKPQPGMLEAAIAAWDLDPARSYMVGDKNSDVDVGRALGLTTILVETGYGKEARATTHADYIEKDLSAAAVRILTLCNTTR